jgi:HK97 family phage portal protein
VLRRLFTQADESRAITFQSLFLTDALTAPPNIAGVIVNPSTSTKIATVFAAVRLIADSIATLPVDTFYRADGERRPYRPRPEWVDQPDIDRSVGRSDFFQSVLFSVLLNGNAFIRVIRVDGEVAGLRVLDPTRVKVEMDQRGFAQFVFDNTTVIPAEDMVHITDIRRPGALTGMSRVDELKDVLGISRALDEFAARYFGQGTVSSGIINVPGDLTQEQAERLKEQFEKNSKGMRNAHRPNILSGGATYEKMGATAAEAQLVAAREFSVREVARIFKVQPLMLGITEGAGMSRASVEQQHIEFVTITLRPYVHKLEEALGRLLPGPAFLRFNMDGLLRGDLQSRYTAYSIGTQAGFLSINDIRRREDLPPVADGDAHRVPLANVNLDAASIVEQDRRISMAVRLINVGFDPAEVLASLNLPPMDHTGLPSVQLQNAAQHVEADVDEVYPASRDADVETEQRNYAEDIASALSATLRDLPQPVVNVSVPEQPARVRTLERDDEGNITKIVEE